MLCTQPYLNCRASPKSQLCLPSNTVVSYAKILVFMHACLYLVDALQKGLRPSSLSVRDNSSYRSCSKLNPDRRDSDLAIIRTARSAVPFGECETRNCEASEREHS